MFLAQATFAKDKFQPIEGSPTPKQQHGFPVIPNIVVEKQEQQWVNESRYIQIEGEDVYS